jgi:hypothetical protein
MASLRPLVYGAPASPSLGSTLVHFLLEMQGGREANYLSYLQSAGSVPSSEEISTFTEIANDYGPESLLDAFQNLIRRDHVERAAEDAWKLIDFFGEVESKALDRYSTAIQSRMA